MPRTRTDSHERAAQRQTARERASAIAGRPVTHREAAAILRGDDPSSMLHNQRRRGPSTRSPELRGPHPLALTPALLDQLDAPSDAPDLRLSLGRFPDLRMTPEGIATVTFAADAHGFGDVLHDAISASPARLLAVAGYVIPGPRWDADEPSDTVADYARLGVRLHAPHSTSADPYDCDDFPPPTRHHCGRITLDALDVDRLASVGRFLCHVRELRTLPRQESALRLVTNGRAFADGLRYAVLASVGRQLVCHLRLLPAPAGQLDT
jgi:hypothetical protein